MYVYVCPVQISQLSLIKIHLPEKQNEKILQNVSTLSEFMLKTPHCQIFFFLF